VKTRADAWEARCHCPQDARRRVGPSPSCCHEGRL
jgi:hypothetical protein